MSTAQFHLAFGVRDLEEARAFYLETIGCKQGRETANHIDFDMFGHHVVAHLVPAGPQAAPSEFDGHEVPVPHFGVNLDRDDWDQLAERLKRSRCRFREYPHARLVGQVGEHDTLFVYDPSGNSLEFKSFRNPSHVFATDAQHGRAPVPGRDQLLRPRIEAAIHRIRGSVQEELLTSGFLDSIGAMELASAMQDDLGIPLAELELRDLATVTTLVAAVAAAEHLAAVAARRQDAAAAAPAEER
jgi:extradiol dioxygenase family protein/acyl carrier protein